MIILTQDATVVAQILHSAPGAQLDANGTVQTFTVSRFPKLSNPNGTAELLDWHQLCGKLTTCDVRPDKEDGTPDKDGPLISPAIYKDGAIYRKSENVEAFSGLYADCDESHTLAEIRAIIAKKGVRAIVYSTHSHGIPDTVNHPDAHAPGERYRVFFPLETPVSAKDYPDVWERLNILFGSSIDTNCRSLERAYFLPSHPTGDGFIGEVFRGRLLCVDDLPELAPDYHAPQYIPASGDGNGTGRPGDDFNNKATNEETARIIEPKGWRVTRSTSGRWYARRPGKRDAGNSATIGHYGPGTFHVFTSNAAPFESGRTYKPFGVLALLEHGGDFKAAARALAKDGFGDKGGFGGFGGFGDFPDVNEKKEGEETAKEDNHAQNRENEDNKESNTPDNQGGSGGFGGFGGNSENEKPKFPKLPLPLGARLRPVPDFFGELLPAPLRAFVADASERISCPPDFVAVPLVISLGSLIGRSILIRPGRFDDWAVAPNLWGAVIGRPGSKKSPAASEGQRHLDRLQAEALADFETAEKGAEFENEINEVQRAAIKKKMAAAAHKGTATRAELEEIRREAESLEDAQTTLKRYVVSDTTVESLGVTLSENPRGVLQSRDELTGWLNSLDKPGRETDKAFYLEAFNGTKQNFIYDRIGRGRLKIPHVCVSLFGTIQPGPLGELIRAASGEKRQRDGFISRFQLLVYPDSIPYKRADRYPDKEAKNRAFEVFRALDSITPEMVGAETDDDDGAPFLRFDAEAQKFFDKWLDALEVRLASGKESALLEEHFSKYRSLMPSLALIFHLADVVDGDAEPGPVSLRAAATAAAWCQYLEAHARRIYGQAFGGDNESLERLGEKLPELPNPFTVRDVYKKGWAGLTEQKEVERLLLLLHEAHWVAGRNVKTDPKKGGKPTVKFWINPALLGEGGA